MAFADEDPLAQIESTALRLILLRLAVRGRLALEQDLKSLEDRVGRELPEVRIQLDRVFETETAALGTHVSGPPRALPEPSADGVLVQRRPGRPRKDGPPQQPE